MGRLVLADRVRRRGRRAPRRPPGRRRLGRVAASQVGLLRPGRTRGRRPHLHERHARPRDRSDPLRALLRRERQDGRRRHGLQVHGLERLGDHRARLRPRAHARGRRRPRRRPSSRSRRSCRTSSSRGRARASSSPGSSDVDVESLGYFRFLPHQVHVGRVPVWVSRTGYSGELGYELFTEPDYAEELWGVLTEAGAKPYGLSAVESLRIESGLIFIGYDYFQHETDPFDMSLDKVIRLDTGDFHGKAALAETAKSPPQTPRHARGRGLRGARVRRRGHEGRRAGRHADEPRGEPDARPRHRHGRPGLRASRRRARRSRSPSATAPSPRLSTTSPSTTRRRRGRAASRPAQTAMASSAP